MSGGFCLLRGRGLFGRHFWSLKTPASFGSTAQGTSVSAKLFLNLAEPCPAPGASRHFCGQCHFVRGPALRSVHCGEMGPAVGPVEGSLKMSSVWPGRGPCDLVGRRGWSPGVVTVTFLPFPPCSSRLSVPRHWRVRGLSLTEPHLSTRLPLAPKQMISSVPFGKQNPKP